MASAEKAIPLEIIVSEIVEALKQHPGFKSVGTAVDAPSLIFFNYRGAHYYIRPTATTATQVLSDARFDEYVEIKQEQLPEHGKGTSD